MRLRRPEDRFSSLDEDEPLSDPFGIEDRHTPPMPIPLPVPNSDSSPTEPNRESGFVRTARTSASDEAGEPFLEKYDRPGEKTLPPKNRLRSGRAPRAFGLEAFAANARIPLGVFRSAKTHVKALDTKQRVALGVLVLGSIALILELLAKPEPAAQPAAPAATTQVATLPAPPALAPPTVLAPPTALAPPTPAPPSPEPEPAPQPEPVRRAPKPAHRAERGTPRGAAVPSHSATPKSVPEPVAPPIY